MAGLVTHRFRFHNAEQFYEAFSEAAATRLYIFIGRQVPWTDDTNPPTPVDTTRDTYYRVWREMLGAKKVTTNDITYAGKRRDWATGTVYTKYTDNNPNLFSNTFFVLTNQYNVYKCMNNNRGVSSTVQPTGTSTSIIETSDGYKWKYMYTIGAGEALQFITTEFIPAKTLSANDGSGQWDVQQAAVNGAIEIVEVTANGSGYLTSNGNFASVANSTVMVLGSAANTSDASYVNSTIYLRSGLGSGQIRRVTNYVGTTKTLTVNGAFTTTPNTSSEYYIGPNVLIYGDGLGALAYANVASGQITKVEMISVGQNYSNAEIEFSANAGSGAIAAAYLPPFGGHGSDPVRELGAHNVIINVRLDGTEANTLPANNDFRSIGVLKDPVLSSTGAVANGVNYRQTTELTLNVVSGSFSFDESVVGGTSAAVANAVNFSNTNSSGTTGVLRINSISPRAYFSVGETVTGGTSGATANVMSISGPELRQFSGDILFIENKAPIARTASQAEDLKLVVKF